LNFDTSVAYICRRRRYRGCRKTERTCPRERSTC
jgi:hypothetical protein